MDNFSVPCDKVWVLAANLMDAYNVQSYDRKLARYGEHAMGELTLQSGRSVSNDIHDLPVIYSGFISKKLVDKKTGFRKSPWKPSKEHFYNRGRSGKDIVKKLHAGALTFVQLVSLLDKYRQVHLITSKENRKLQQIQKKYPTLSHVEHQKLAKVVLVPDPGPAPTVKDYPVIAEGVYYQTVTICAAETGTKFKTVIDRCRNERNTLWSFASEPKTDTKVD